ncbi:MAG: flavodoxin family protein [Desulfovibrionaceae bacterium]|jgi:putative NADPH-quinone reductase|nr:flavodoxin family protein [Desulfovibrionaceae bacterium]
MPDTRIDAAQVDWARTGAVFACSPRAGGNSDAAAEHFARGAVRAGAAAHVIHLRDHQVLPCLACSCCADDPDGRCPLALRDQSAPLFDALCRAPFVCFAAPIFFYHLPAHLKAFIDRGQSFYQRRRAGDAVLAALPRRKAWVALVAGRPAGERLFDGAVLTLKYFLEPFNLELAGTHLYRGVDEPGDLGALEAACEQLEASGSLAAREAAARP